MKQSQIMFLCLYFIYISRWVPQDQGENILLLSKIGELEPSIKMLTYVSMG